MASLSPMEAESHRKFNAVISFSGLINASKWFGAGLFGKKNAPVSSSLKRTWVFSSWVYLSVFRVVHTDTSTDLYLSVYRQLITKMPSKYYTVGYGSLPSTYYCSLNGGFW